MIGFHQFNLRILFVTRGQAEQVTHARGGEAIVDLWG